MSVAAESSLPQSLLPPSRASDEEKLKLFTDYSAFLFDLDGTLWLGDRLVKGAAEVMDLLRTQGKKVFFVTNNSSMSRQTCLKKIQSLGIKASVDEVYTSSFAAASYLKGKKAMKGKKVYVLGEAGIVDELTGVGIEAVGGPADASKTVDFTPGKDPVMHVDREVGAVVAGLDRGINYYKVQYGLTCLLENEGCLFVATNTDSRGNFSMDQEWAGAGATVGALIGASEAEPMVVGKPSPFLLDAICNKSGLQRNQLCIIGDRLDTDILWGSRHGCGTVLVLSGITSEAYLKSPENKIYPTHYIDSVGDLLSVKDKLAYACIIS